MTSHDVGFSPTFVQKYKPYYVTDFGLNVDQLFFLSTFLEMNDFNILCIGNTNTGKTTFLWALIRYYYGLTKDEPFNENHILFIHALKDQGIHFFRNEMKSFCQSRPCLPNQKKKMIVVDDLDTYPQQSQQIFCNYMDKYRNNIVFVSVCSSLEKVIESIQSRIHILVLPTPTTVGLEQLLTKIVERESLTLTETTRSWILYTCQGSPRKLMNYLEKIYILGEERELQDIASSIPWELFDQFICHVRGRENLAATRVLYDMYDCGYSVIDILDTFFSFLKMSPKVTSHEKYKIIIILCRYITQFHTVHEHSLELAHFAEDVHEIMAGNILG
jgi:DNA polymerase III delta prime subunit